MIENMTDRGRWPNTHTPHGAGPANPDPLTDSAIRRGMSLTDSGVHRIGVATRVRIYLEHEDPIEVGLLALRDVATWEELIGRLKQRLDLEVLAPRRRWIAAWAVYHVEVVTDNTE